MAEKHCIVCETRVARVQCHACLTSATYCGEVCAEKHWNHPCLIQGKRTELDYNRYEPDYIVRVQVMDGSVIEIPWKYASLSGTLRLLLDDIQDGLIPLPNVTRETMDMVVAFLTDFPRNPRMNTYLDKLYKFMQAIIFLDVDDVDDTLNSLFDRLKSGFGRTAPLETLTTVAEYRAFFGFPADGGFLPEEEDGSSANVRILRPGYQPNTENTTILSFDSNIIMKMIQRLFPPYDFRSLDLLRRSHVRLWDLVGNYMASIAHKAFPKIADTFTLIELGLECQRRNWDILQLEEHTMSKGDIEKEFLLTTEDFKKLRTSGGTRFGRYQVNRVLEIVIARYGSLENVRKAREIREQQKKLKDDIYITPIRQRNRTLERNKLVMNDILHSEGFNNLSDTISINHVRIGDKGLWDFLMDSIVSEITPNHPVVKAFLQAAHEKVQEAVRNGDWGVLYKLLTPEKYQEMMENQ